MSREVHVRFWERAEVKSLRATRLPLYRKSQILARHGVRIERSTLAQWVGAAAAELQPLHDHLLQQLKASPKLFCDETRCPVLDPGRGKTKTGYLWAIARDDRPWGGTDPPAVVYAYAPGRGGQHAVKLLGGIAGRTRLTPCPGGVAEPLTVEQHVVVHDLADESSVTFKVKDYRVEGAGRFKTMRLATGEFIRRFLIHVLPKGFHRIRHYGLLANGNRADNVAKARALLAVPMPVAEPEVIASHQPSLQARACPCCGSRMVIMEVFERGSQPKHRPAPVLLRIDTS